MSAELELEFNAEEWKRLTWSERARLCRSRAYEGRLLTADAMPYAKHIYLELSQQWSALAEEIERNSCWTASSIRSPQRRHSKLPH
jgi:hypothetical protein